MLRAFQFQLNNMTKTFTYTDRILFSLSETVMNLNAPNKLDTGLDNSVVAQNAAKVGNGWFKKVLGQAADPGDISTWVSKLKDGNYSSKFFNAAIRRERVRLLEILFEQGQSSNEARNLPSGANYIFLSETNGMYALGGKYYQMFGDSQAVCIDYKGTKATVVAAGTYGNYLVNSVNSLYGEATQYVEHIGTSVLAKTKEHALSVFSNKQDREVINTLMSDGPVPTILYDSISMGVIDTANIPIKTVRGASTTNKYLVAPYLINKDVLILNQAKAAGEQNLNGLASNVKSDISSKLTEFTNGNTPYTRYMAEFNMAMDLQRRNPIKTYNTILKNCITAVNWIVADLRKSIGSGFQGDAMLFFSRPSYEQVIASFNGRLPATSKNFQFVVLRAFNDYDGFPLQVRSFTAVYDKLQEAYISKPGEDKLVVISPGFDNYLRSKASAEGQNNADGYINELKGLVVSESSSFRGSGESVECFYKTIKELYLPTGFNNGTLFKFLPPLLMLDRDKPYEILTSTEKIIGRGLPYIDKLQDVYKKNNLISNGIFPSKIHSAADLLFNPVDSEGILNGSYSQIDDEYSANSISQQHVIAARFKSLHDIQESLSEELDHVTGHEDLQKIGDKFANLLENLSNGFWSVSGDCVASKKLNHQGHRLLGMYNLLGTKLLPIGSIEPALNLDSLDDPATFNTNKKSAIELSDEQLFKSINAQPMKRG